MMLKPLAAVSILALTAHAGRFDLKDNIKAMKEASEKCNSQCGDVGKVISDHCTKLFGNCLTEVCKAASVKPCLECMKTEKVYDKFEGFCDFFGKDTSPSSSSSSASASATSSSSSSSSSSSIPAPSATSDNGGSVAAQDDKKDSGAGYAAPAVGMAAVAAGAVAAFL